MSTWQGRALKERETISEATFAALPDGIIQINSCEVAYVLNPTVFPYSYLEFTTIREALEREYKLHFKMPNLQKGGALSELALPQSIDGMGQLLLSLKEPQLEFENGLFRLPSNRAVKIQSVRLDSETIFVKVAGPTRVAEQVIYEVLPMLWALAGVDKQWSEIAALHQIAMYGTGTRVRFPEQGNSLLAPAFRGLLDSLTTDGGIACGLGSRYALHEWAPPAGSRSIYSLDELQLIFNRQEITGTVESSRLRIGVDAKHERGTGIMSVDSELPLDEHIKLVQELLASLANPG